MPTSYGGSGSNILQCDFNTSQTKNKNQLQTKIQRDRINKFWNLNGALCSLGMVDLDQIYFNTSQTKNKMSFKQRSICKFRYISAGESSSSFSNLRGCDAGVDLDLTL
jgi:hypothetical protein